jgi:hypothetical protein
MFTLETPRVCFFTRLSSFTLARVSGSSASKPGRTTRPDASHSEPATTRAASASTSHG